MYDNSNFCFQTWVLLTLALVLICCVLAKLYQLYREYKTTREIITERSNEERARQERGQSQLATLNQQIISEIRQQ